MFAAERSNADYDDKILHLVTWPIVEAYLMGGKQCTLPTRVLLRSMLAHTQIVHVWNIMTTRVVDLGILEDETTLNVLTHLTKPFMDLVANYRTNGQLQDPVIRPMVIFDQRSSVMIFQNSILERLTNMQDMNLKILFRYFLSVACIMMHDSLTGKEIDWKTRCIRADNTVITAINEVRNLIYRTTEDLFAVQKME